MGIYIEQIDMDDKNPKVNYGGAYILQGAFLYCSLAMYQDVEYAVVTASEKWGYGVWSWHHFKEHADHNARCVNGRVVPVDRHNGTIIMPPLALAATRKALE